MSLSWALHQLAVSIAAVDTAVAARLGLTPTDYLAMKHLLTSPTPLGPADLSRLLGMSTGSATALVDRLERAGHIERRAHPADRRRVVLVPTQRTTDRVADALTPVGAEIDRIEAAFTAEEREAIGRFLVAAASAHEGLRLSVRRP